MDDIGVRVAVSRLDLRVSEGDNRLADSWRGALIKIYLWLLLSVLIAVPAHATGSMEDPPAFVLLWGGYGTIPGRFDSPLGLAVDANGNVYVADTGNDRVQKFTREGVYIADWGGPFSLISTGLLDSPWAIACGPDGNVYVTDDSSRVVVFSSSGALIRTWGSRGTGAGRFTRAEGIAVDGAGDVYVSDYGRGSRIQKFTNTGAFLLEWTTLGGKWLPQGIAVHESGVVYVADGGFGGRIHKFTSTGEPLDRWDIEPPSAARFLATDGLGNVYVTLPHDDLVRKYSPAGKLLTQWSQPGHGPGQLYCPTGVAMDSEGSIYVAESECGLNHRIQRFSDPSVPTVRNSWNAIKRLYR